VGEVVAATFTVPLSMVTGALISASIGASVVIATAPLTPMVDPGAIVAVTFPVTSFTVAVFEAMPATSCTVHDVSETP